MSTESSSVGTFWWPNSQRRVGKMSAKDRLILPIRRDAQTRTPPPVTLPRLACLAEVSEPADD
jgi:hypothetical protein